MKRTLRVLVCLTFLEFSTTPLPAQQVVVGAVSWPQSNAANLSAPSAPTVAVPSSGGSLAASQEATVEITYVDLAGETVASSVTNQTTATSATCTGSGNCQFVITSPAASADATGWNVYANTCASTPCSSLTKQNASPIAIGTNYTWTTLSSGATPPGSNTSGGGVANATATITTGGLVQTALTTNTTVPTYIVTGTTGPSGSSGLAAVGIAKCTMDSNLSNTGNFFVINSVLTAGDCHAQSAAPSSGVWVIGYMHDSSTTSGATSLVQIDSFTYGGGSSSVARGFGASFGDSAGPLLVAGSVTYYTVPYACTVNAWNVTADAGTVTFDVWKTATGTAIPTSGNAITGSAKPALSTGTALHSTTLTGWTTSVSANDIVGVQLNTVSGAHQVSLVVGCQ